MSDWSALTDAYGSARDIPDLVDRLATAPDDAAWQKAWSRLCHQGTVYPASYAALPLLHALAAARPAGDRSSPLMLIGAIVASEDLLGVDRRPAEVIEPLMHDLARLAEECMAEAGDDTIAFIHLLQAACAFDGDLFWGRHLDHLADGEFPGSCPACACDLDLAIGANGFFATIANSGRPRREEPKRHPIAPLDNTAPTSRAAWLVERAHRHRQPEVASWIPYVFGSASCPACGRPFDVARAIACLYERR